MTFWTLAVAAGFPIGAADVDPAILLVTHDVDEAILLADRIGIPEEGRLVLNMPIDLPPTRELRSRQALAVGDQLLERLSQPAFG